MGGGRWRGSSYCATGAWFSSAAVLYLRAEHGIHNVPGQPSTREQTFVSFARDRQGDVVVFDRITTDGEVVQHDDLIKRVIALPGETIEIRECVVFIDGKELLEPYLNDYDLKQVNLEDRCRVPELEPVEISSGHIFVMGDNRPQSFDSRMFGEIETDLVVGRAFTLIWPLSNARWL